MFVLNFQKQFAPAVESGAKHQSIRAERKDGKRPVPGEHIRCYTGMRTSGCRRLGDFTCLSVSGVRIFMEGQCLAIVVDGKRLSFSEGLDLAQADGFSARADFVGFFEDAHGLPFEGFLTKWN